MSTQPDLFDAGEFPIIVDEWPEEIFKEPDFYTVALAYHDRAFGGPEEGGWYYDTYVPLNERVVPGMTDTWDLPRTFTDLDDACRWAETLNRMIKEADFNAGKYRPSSVLSRGDWVVAFVFDGLPAVFPKERPYYE